MWVRFRHSAMMFVGAVLGALCVLLLKPLRPTPVTAADSQAVAESTLLRRLPTVDFQGVALNQAVARLSQLSGVPIKLDTAGLRQKELSPDYPIDLRLRNAELHAVLTTLSENYNASVEAASPFTQVDIGWCVTADGVLISVIDQIGDRALIATRVYDISAAAPGGPPTGPATVAGCFGPVAVSLDPRDDLVNLVADAIRPDTWRHNGGTAGWIYRIGNRLIVCQTVDAQLEVRQLLDQVLAPKTANADPLPIDPAEVSVFHPQLRRWVSQSTDRADAALRRTLAEFSVRDCPLGEAIERLSLAGELDLYPDPEAEVPLTRKVTVALKGAPVWQILRSLLNAAENTPREHVVGTAPRTEPQWHWWLDGAVVVIGKPPRLAGTTRVYDIAPFLDTEIARLGLTGQTASLERDALADSLILQLQQMTCPDTWREAGGEVGACRFLFGQLVVTQTWENHEYVRTTLAELIKRPSTRPALDAPPEP